jgi:hypothetical protein
MAPEFYGNLKYHSSWTRLLFQFIFDRRYSLYSRVERMKQKDGSNAPWQMTNHKAGNLDMSARPISF